MWERNSKAEKDKTTSIPFHFTQGWTHNLWLLLKHLQKKWQGWKKASSAAKPIGRWEETEMSEYHSIDQYWMDIGERYRRAGENTEKRDEEWGPI